MKTHPLYFIIGLFFSYCFSSTSIGWDITNWKLANIVIFLIFGKLFWVYLTYLANKLEQYKL